MLLSDIFGGVPRNTNCVSMTESEIQESVKRLCADFNWQYDLDILDERTFENGKREMNLIEEQLTELFRRNKEAAMGLWESQCPFSVPGVIPQFIFQRQ